MIESRGLRCAYPGSDPFSLPDVDVAQGGTLLLRGPSGSGKSTWLALAAGLLTPSAGEIVVAGQSVGALGGAARDAWRARHIGFLPQRLHLSEALTVADNLALAFYAAGLPVDQAALARTLDTLGLKELARRRPSQLSGGQAQRAALARAVLLRPKVILADEPTASLDDDTCANALALLRQTADTLEATLVMATHDARVCQALPHAQALVFEALSARSAA
ncbi:MAG: ABC transporter ATP-binding protein [Hydrogenophaga sp.]|uniref:ABC transporter ATP-binding protein n=1 Tax=Hydrogenophaga sp. TaxID=1904254 RepID=UPI001D492ECA|nr:ATP-binding cassette domain-containing protein [Hydrogenophaga sp.]MBW0172706.1 ATP-binding cassette domain-containing protein [Hydrogenophaga sp.]MBW0183620.1 ATP-binding cassette domain-containing protein [Hydrogenophaga sp.]